MEVIKFLVVIFFLLHVHDSVKNYSIIQQNILTVFRGEDPRFKCCTSQKLRARQRVQVYTGTAYNSWLKPICNKSTPSRLGKHIFILLEMLTYLNCILYGMEIIIKY